MTPHPTTAKRKSNNVTEGELNKAIHRLVASFI
jgi:hypothetical protein